MTTHKIELTKISGSKTLPSWDILDLDEPASMLTFRDSSTRDSFPVDAEFDQNIVRGSKELTEETFTCELTINGNVTGTLLWRPGTGAAGADEETEAYLQEEDGSQPKLDPRSPHSHE